jgi:hypothetical protein
MYNEEANRKVANGLFSALQLFLLLITYAFLYTIFIASKLAIVEQHLTMAILVPPLLGTLLYPYILYRCRKMYLRGQVSHAMGWMAAWSVIIIVVLYALLAQFMNL